MRKGANVISWIGLGILLAVSSIGCCHEGDMRKFDVSITLQDSLRDARGIYPAVEVDLVAVNAVDLDQWKGKSMTEYFRSDDKLRESADHLTVTLGDDHRSQTLSLKDKNVAKVWDKWKQQGVHDLLVPSSQPRGEDKPGGEDPRRRILPLGCERWDGDVKQLNVVVTPVGLKVTPSPKS